SPWNSKGISYLFNRYWGWLSVVIRPDGGSLSQYLSEIMSEMAAAEGVYTKNDSSRDEIGNHNIPLSKVAKDCGISRQTLRKITNKLNITEEFCEKGRTLYIYRGAITLINEVIS